MATAKTMTPVIAKLKAWGAHRIVACVILASAEGLRALHEAHPDVEGVCYPSRRWTISARWWFVAWSRRRRDRLFGATGVLSAKDIVANEALEKQLALGATYAWEEAGARPTRPRRPRLILLKV